MYNKYCYTIEKRYRKVNTLSTLLYLNTVVLKTLWASQLLLRIQVSSCWQCQPGHWQAPSSSPLVSALIPLRATFSIVIEHVSMSLNNELCRQWTFFGFFPVGIFFWLDRFPITLSSPPLSQALCEHNRRGGTRGETSGREGACLLTRSMAELAVWLELN